MQQTHAQRNKLSVARRETGKIPFFGWLHHYGLALFYPRNLAVKNSSNPAGAFHSTKNSGNSGYGSEWNRRFPEFHSEILGVPREVGLKFRKIGITGKFRSIRPFLLALSFSERGNRTQHGFQFFCSISVFRLLLCDR